MLIYNHSLKLCANPDLIGDDIVIDMKISKKKNILNRNNYMQILSYGILADINNVCLYDIENGVIYEGIINNKDNIIKYIYSSILEELENKKTDHKNRF
jgi:hypothetical protein